MRKLPIPIALFLILLLTMTTMNAQTLSFRDILNRPERPQPALKIMYGAHPDQHAELWLPTLSASAAAASNMSPVIILVHGGCWRADLPGAELVAFLADDLRRQGIAVWSITYRRVGTAASQFSPYPGTFLDVAAATDHLTTIAPEYKLDLTRVVTTGHSAGGHLAMWLAARNRLPIDSPLYRNNPLPIRATVGIAAIADLQVGKTMSAHACGADTIDLLIDSRTRKNAFADTSVSALLPLGIPQTLISGVYDAIVAPAQAHRYRERAKEKGEAVELLTLDNAGHFELIAPWTPAGRQVADKLLATMKSLTN